MRCTKVAATASVSGIPAAVRPRIIPASTTPMPPGTGETPPSMDASVMTMKMVAKERCCPKAWSAAPRDRATIELSRQRPAEQLHQLGRPGGQNLEVSPDLVQLGPGLVGSQPSQPGDGQRHADQDDDQDDDGQEEPDGLAVVPRAVLPVVGEVHVAPRQGKGDEKQSALHDPAGRAHQGAGGHGLGGIEALLLEEAHPCGERGGGPPGQGGKGVGELESHHPTVGEHRSHGADLGQRRRRIGQLGQHGGRSRPSPTRHL